MEIVSNNPVTLCNYEVMTLLQKIRAGPKKQKGQLATITYEALRYLEGTPCKTQTNEAIQNCLKSFEPFKLNKNEKLMLINNTPSTPLEIQIDYSVSSDGFFAGFCISYFSLKYVKIHEEMIDEGEERLTQEQVDEILQIISQHLSQPEAVE